MSGIGTAFSSDFLARFLPNAKTDPNRTSFDLDEYTCQVRDLRDHDRSVMHDPRVWGYFYGGTPKNRPPGIRARSLRRRPWKNITAIMLHTTDVKNMGWRRFVGVPAHLGVDKDAIAVLMFRLDEYVEHGNQGNGFSIGIEISGRRAATLEQVVTTRALVTAARRQILANGGGRNGRVAIMAHRQTDRSRAPDPGEQIWRDVGVWAMETLDCPLGPVLGSGQPIPNSLIGEKWD